jgi:hypothetical protein
LKLETNNGYIYVGVELNYQSDKYSETATDGKALNSCTQVCPMNSPGGHGGRPGHNT